MAADDSSVPSRASWLAFGGLSFGLAWALWIVCLWPQLRGDVSARVCPWVALGMLAPGFAAAVARRVYGERSQGTWGLWRRPGVYLIAYVVPALVVMSVLGLALGSGLARWTREGGMSLALAFPLTLWVGGTIGGIVAFGEEYGWRGFLLKRLLHLGEVRASGLVGLVWAVWHLPVIVAGLNYGPIHPGLAMAVFTLSCLVLSYGLTLLFVATRGSAWICGLCHGVLNAGVDGFTASNSLDGPTWLVGGTGLLGALVMLALALLYRAFRGPLDPAMLVARTDAQVDGTWRDWLR